MKNRTDPASLKSVETKRLPKATASTFYRKLDETLGQIGFTDGVREICRPAYADVSRGGRPGIDPSVYFKMLMIGFFENLPSERSIASRCADSLSLRAFLGYQLDQDTPDHSSLSVIRGRLGEEIYQSALELVLKGLRGEKGPHRTALTGWRGTGSLGTGKSSTPRAAQWQSRRCRRRGTR